MIAKKFNQNKTIIPSAKQISKSIKSLDKKNVLYFPNPVDETFENLNIYKKTFYTRFGNIFSLILFKSGSLLESRNSILITSCGLSI